VHLFLHEYTCGGALAGMAGTASLRAEGWAMLAALAGDLAALPGVRVSTLLEPERELGPQIHCRHVGTDEEDAAFRQETQAADLTLVIAPETGGILGQRCRWVTEVGGRWLGCTADAIALTGDKWALSRHLGERGILAPPCYLLPAGGSLNSVSFPVVLKPRWGAGSQATMLVRAPAELPAALEQARLEAPGAELLLQPFVAGLAASVAFLIGPRTCVPLAPAEQALSPDGRFHYLGGVVPLAPPLARRAERIAGRAVAALSGLGGYVGVDVVLGGATDGNQDCVIEINPRLTTSYVGLRALAEENLAGILLRVWQGEQVPAVRWRQGPVHFRSSGEISTRF
jgi:predicted ATP-grasp superfamily ATP-dependent carboligase